MQVKVTQAVETVDKGIKPGVLVLPLVGLVQTDIEAAPLLAEPLAKVDVIGIGAPIAMAAVIGLPLAALPGPGQGILPELRHDTHRIAGKAFNRVWTPVRLNIQRTHAVDEIFEPGIDTTRIAISGRAAKAVLYQRRISQEGLPVRGHRLGITIVKKTCIDDSRYFFADLVPVIEIDIGHRLDTATRRADVIFRPVELVVDVIGFRIEKKVP